jgi:membrane-associated phospholipid phosphatase
MSPALVVASIAAASIGLLVVLGGMIRAGALDAFDKSLLSWVTGVEFYGIEQLTTAFDQTLDGPIAAAIVIGTVGTLFALKRSGAAMALMLGMGILAVTYLPSDWALANLADRVRPIPSTPDLSFASGHVLFATVIAGFGAWLAVRRRPISLLSIAAFALATAFVLAASFTRVNSLAHHPSDVIGGPIWGIAGLSVLILVFRRFENVRWIAAPKMGRDLPMVEGDHIRFNGSYASAVVLDSKAGTATKHFRPPAIIQALYWAAFQSRFPYDHNVDALEATTHRRKIASLLTRFHFGKDHVAAVLSIDWNENGQPSMVTELIPGHEAENDAPAKKFLGEVSELFGSAGLPVWQLNPKNPHAHTNLILNPEGDYKIVDLESAVVTPFPAKGQFRSALKRGAYPVFDDIDFDRLREYVATNESEMRSAIGADGMLELETAIEAGERSIKAWHRSETRLASKLIKITYAIFNWTGAYRGLRSLIATSDERAEAFLVKGLDTWQEEGRISALEADETRQYLAGREVHDGLRHLGAHLAITAVFRFPFGSILRPMWTLGFFIRELSLRVRSGTRDRRGSLMMHGPHVMLLSIIPGFGGMAYVVSGPLRKPVLPRLMLDRMARKLRLGDRFAPKVLAESGEATPAVEQADIAIPTAVAARPTLSELLELPELKVEPVAPGSPFIAFRDACVAPLERCLEGLRSAGESVKRACGRQAVEQAAAGAAVLIESRISEPIRRLSSARTTVKGDAVETTGGSSHSPPITA